MACPPGAGSVRASGGTVVSGLIDTFFNGEVMLRALPMLGRGLVNTFYLAVAAIVLGTLAGILICIARLYGPKPVRTPGGRLHRHLSRAADPGGADRHLLRAALRRDQAQLLHLGDDRAFDRARRVHGGSVPRRHQGHPGRPVRGGARARPAVLRDAAQGHPPAGDPHRDAAADLATASRSSRTPRSPRSSPCRTS